MVVLAVVVVVVLSVVVIAVAVDVVVVKSGAGYIEGRAYQTLRWRWL